MDDLTTKPLSELKAIAGHQLLVTAYRFGIEIVGDKRRRATWVNFLERCWEARLMEESPGVDRPQESIGSEHSTGNSEHSTGNAGDLQAVASDFTDDRPPNRGEGRGNRVENSIDAGRVQGAIAICPESRLILGSVGGSNSPGAIEFPDMESALAEIARLKAKNTELEERLRSQSETVRRAKDISPVQRPSFSRVLRLARSACLELSKSLDGWLLNMGKKLTRTFSGLKEIWELLIQEDWCLTELFGVPDPATSPIFPKLTYNRFLAVPFCDDELIDTWALGYAAGGDRAPPVAP